MTRSLLTGRVVTACLLALAARPAAGQTWTGTSNSLWTVASNWSSNPTLPASGADTQLVFGAAANAGPQNNVPGTFQLNRLTFNAGAPAYTLSGNALDFRTNTLRVGPQVVQNSANAVTVANNLVLTDVLTVGGTGAGTVTLSGAISGAGGLTVSAAGAVRLGGSNTFGGGLDVGAGTLSITSPTAVPDGGSVVVRRGAVFQLGFLNGDNAAAPIGELSLLGGTLRMQNGSGDYYLNRLTVGESGGSPGAIDFGGGILSALDLRLTGAGAGISVTADTTWTGGGTSGIRNDGATPADVATNGRTITNGLRLGNGAGGQGFRLTGGGTMVLTNPGNSADLTADAARLEVADLAHLGSGTITLRNAGELRYTGPTAASSKPLVLDAGGGTVFVTGAGTNLTLSGTIGETTAGQRLTLFGSPPGGPTLTLTGANTYTGPTTILGAVASVASLPNGGVAGPLGASTAAASNLVVSVGGRLQYTGPTAATDRGITFVNAARGLEVAGAATNLTVTGQVAGAAVTKLGPGTLTLANPGNSFTGGLFVNGGVVAITHPAAVPAGSNVTVAAGGEFRVATGALGTSPSVLGAVTLAGGTFAVPNPGTGYSHVNRVELGAGGRVDLTGSNGFTLALTGAGAGISVTGDATWAGAGASTIQNATGAPIDLSVAPGVTLTSSVRLTNGSLYGQGFRLTGGGTLAVTNTDNAAALTVGPATLRFGDVAVLGPGALTLDGGTLAYTGPTTASDKSLTLAPGGGTISITDPAASLNWTGTIGGGHTLTKTGPGRLWLNAAGNTLGALVVDAGRVDVSAEGNLGGATVTVNAAGTLRYRGSATAARTFTLNGGTLETSAGTTLTLDGATVHGGFLASYGTGKFVLTNNAAVHGSTLFGGTTVEVAGPAALTNVTTGANATVAAGQTLTLTRGRQTAAGTLTVNGTVVAQQGWESAGVLRVAGGASPGLMRVDGTPLVLGGGSRTYIGANATGQRGGTILLGPGNTIELNGGLLVNNGDFVASGIGGIQGGAVNVNYGSLAKGTGYYDEVNVTDGGKFAPGNSITDSTVGSLTLNSGSVYEFEINLANGVAGGGGTTPPRGWDRLTLTRLTVNATPESPAVIQLVTRNAADTGPGTLPDFDPAQGYRWQAFRGELFQGFSPDKFAFDTTGFANLTDPSGVGTFALELTGSSVFVTYTPVPEPGLVVAVAAAGLAAGGLVRRRRVTRVRRGEAGC